MDACPDRRSCKVPKLESRLNRALWMSDTKPHLLFLVEVQSDEKVRRR